MSSDGYFESDIDENALEAIDAIEAAALNSPSPSPVRKPQQQCRPALPQKETSFYDLTFDFDEDALQKIDNITDVAFHGKVAGPSKAKYQTTLFGDVLPPQRTKPATQVQRTRSLSSRDIFAPPAPPKEKKWDHTQFAQTGTKPSKGKGKAKRVANDEDEEEAVEFEQFPAPFVSGTLPKLIPYPFTDMFLSRPPPMKLKPDLLETKHWIYPLNRPKRDYQFNIVKRCLFDNTIVALPTGLGKTFIAGVVMLNYYRWYPHGKVVFVAPTKPLVAQQIDACHEVCGIPGSDAAELTGAIAKPARVKLWAEKRVFYMTPQTLVNDLKSHACDVRDIVLLVVDEAHRATGAYAYNEIVQYLMAKNPHHRLLALTATPGSNPDAVQTLVDGLHISRIEIRNEDSLDIKPYIHKKSIKQHIVNMNDDVVKIRDMLGKVIDAEMRPLKSAGIIWPTADPAKFHPYAAMAKMRELRPDQKWGYAALTRLSSLARAMGYLIEGSIGMCHTYLQAIMKEGDGPGSPAKGKGGAKGNKKLKGDPAFQELGRVLESMAPTFPTHPKMDLMKTLLVQHFGQALRDGEEASSTRVMVFSTFREAVDEIVAFLESEKPLIKATRFIGQSADKQGKKGMTQKEQLGIIERFKQGEFNVLVATAIGEEGLDIGEVDMIVCYDAQKTPIRMLQRLGRTGRKRAGHVHVLLAEGREELNLDKAKDAYKEIQKSIIRGDQLELYTDVPRLLPDHVKPEVLEQQMETQPYVREVATRASTSKKGTSTAGDKRKRNDDMMRNIPDGASTGFVTVSSLLVKGGAKKRKTLPKKDFDAAGEDDDDDLDLESGSVLALRRTKSVQVKHLKEKANLRRTKTATSRATKKSVKIPTSSQFSGKGNDDSEDEDLASGLVLPRKSTPPRLSISRRYSDSPSSAPSEFLGPQAVDNSHSPAGKKRENHADMSWLIDEDEDAIIEIVDSSPSKSKATSSSGISSKAVVDESFEFDGPFDSSLGSPKVSSQGRRVTIQLPESSDFGWSSPPRPEEPSMDLGSSDLDIPISVSSPDPRATASIPIEIKGSDRISGFDSPEKSQDMPATTFPVQRHPKRRQIIPESPDIRMGSPQRLQRRQSPRVERPRSSKPRVALDHNDEIYDLAAIHSGDEVSEGSSGEEEEENSSDREFLRPLPETQASPSYNQTQAYRQSLLSQAPRGRGPGGPAFFGGPARRGQFGVPQRTQARQRRAVSSSPPRGDNEEPDAYEMDSFIVDDDAEISYLTDDDLNMIL